MQLLLNIIWFVLVDVWVAIAIGQLSRAPRIKGELGP
jgi:uncharacterized membrane protein YccF (DUF307 family)